MAPKTVLITGCSAGGIGAALAQEFHRHGHTVFAGVRTPSKAASLADIGITVVEIDVTSTSSIASAVETIRRKTEGKLDILVNNAGVNGIMPFLDTPVEEMRRVLDTNVLGVFAVTQAFVPLLMETRGIVANLGSVTPMYVPPFQTAYVASKAALSAFSDTLRIELKPFGVRVVHIIAGAIQTHLFDCIKPGQMPEGSLYEPLRRRIEDLEFMGEKWTTAEEFAKKVARDLLQPNPAIAIWHGTYTTTAWLFTFGWRGMLDWAYMRYLGLGSLKPRST